MRGRNIWLAAGIGAALPCLGFAFTQPGSLFASTIPGAMIELSKYGAVCDGVTDNSTPLTNAAAEAAAAHGGSSTIHITQGNCLINSNVNVTGSLALDPGGMLNVTNGHIVTISGQVLGNPNQTMFPGSGSVVISGTQAVHVGWWLADAGDLGVARQQADTALGGCVSDGGYRSGRIIDDTGGGNAATRFHLSPGHHLVLGEGTYTASHSYNCSLSATYQDCQNATIIMQDYTSVEGTGNTTILRPSIGVADGFTDAGPGTLVTIGIDPEPPCGTSLQQEPGFPPYFAGIGTNKSIEVRNLEIDDYPDASQYGEVAQISGLAVDHATIQNVTVRDPRGYAVSFGAVYDGPPYLNVWQGDAGVTAGYCVRAPTGLGTGWAYCAQDAGTTAPYSYWYPSPPSGVSWPTVPGATVVDGPDGGAVTWVATARPYANDIKIVDNTVTGCAAQSIVCTACTNFIIDDNNVIGRQPYSAAASALIDVEVNANDAIQYFSIAHNILNLTDGFQLTAPASNIGLQVSGGGATLPLLRGAGVIADNTILGRDMGATTSGAPYAASIGINLINVTNVDVHDNNIHDFRAAGILMVGNNATLTPGSCQFNNLHDNRIYLYAGGPAIEIGDDCSQNTIEHNQVFLRTNPAGATEFVEDSTGGGNVFEGNKVIAATGGTVVPPAQVYVDGGSIEINDLLWQPDSGTDAAAPNATTFSTPNVNAVVQP